MRFLASCFVLVAVLAHGASSIRSSKGCGGNEDTDFEDGSADRTLLQEEVEEEKTRSCSWHLSSKTCAMSMAALAKYYNKIETEALKLHGFSIQLGFGNNKLQFGGVMRSKKNNPEGRCEPVLMSDVNQLSECYGQAENVFLRECDLTRSQCKNWEVSPGCSWNEITDCSFSFQKFAKDMGKLAAKNLDVTATFNDSAVKKIRRLENQKCPFAKDEESCLEIEGCIFDGTFGNCIPRPSVVMKMAKITRKEPSVKDKCDLADLILTGECENGTESTCNKKSGNKCFWDSGLQRCMPSPASVFETMAQSNEDLMTDFKSDAARCKEEGKNEKSCEALMTEED
ncbi:hypothetical protein BSKO_07035 [Bryopsis sp. KO-2023]|nr:hypothetical protein BSKO_07035 [Bryopsis sp. KO-2023]